MNTRNLQGRKVAKHTWFLSKMFFIACEINLLSQISGRVNDLCLNVQTCCISDFSLCHAINKLKFYLIWLVSTCYIWKDTAMLADGFPGGMTTDLIISSKSNSFSSWLSAGKKIQRKQGLWIMVLILGRLWQKWKFGS